MIPDGPALKGWEIYLNQQILILEYYKLPHLSRWGFKLIKN